METEGNEMMYCVEIGGMEVFVDLVSHGIKDAGVDPIFNVTAGTDWDGVPYPLTREDEEDAIRWVITNYGHEVYML